MITAIKIQSSKSVQDYLMALPGYAEGKVLNITATGFVWEEPEIGFNFTKAELAAAVRNTIYRVGSTAPVEPSVTPPSDTTFDTVMTDDPIPAGAYIGTVSASGSLPITYTLGGTHASLLEIRNGNAVHAINEITGGMVNSMLSFTVQASNSAGVHTSEFLSVELITESSTNAPTYIELTLDEIQENSAAGTAVGVLHTNGKPLATLSIDQTYGDFAYFNIVEGELVAAQTMPVYGTAPLSVKVIATNTPEGTTEPVSYSKSFSINIVPAQVIITTALDPYSSPLNFEEAKHLLFRTTQGPDMADIRKYVGLTPLQALEDAEKGIAKGWEKVQKNHLQVFDADGLLVSENPALGPRSKHRDGYGYPYITTQGKGASDPLQASSYLVDAILGNELSLDEQVVLFLREFLASITSRSRLAGAIWWQDQLFRKYALGNWKEMLGKLPKDYAMQYNLDGGDNRVNNSLDPGPRIPDENYGREHLELYTIGKGRHRAEGDFTHYREADVNAAAMVFTGWRYEQELPDYTGVLNYIDPDTKLPTLKPVPFSLHEFQKGFYEYNHVTGLGRFNYNKQGDKVVTEDSDATGWTSAEKEKETKTFSEKFKYAETLAPPHARVQRTYIDDLGNTVAYTAWQIQAPPEMLPAYGDFSKAAYDKLVKCMEYEIQLLNDMIFAQERTAEYQVERIYRWFCNRKIDEKTRTEIILPLAELFRTGEGTYKPYDIYPVMRKLFTSRFFYDIDTTDERKIRGSRVKSPLEYLFGYWRQLEAPNVLSREFDMENIYRQFSTDYGNFVQKQFKPGEIAGTYGGAFGMLGSASTLKAGMEFGNPPEVAGHPAWWLGPTYDESWNMGSQVNYQQSLIKSATYSQGWRATGVTTFELKPGVFTKDPITGEINNFAQVLDTEGQIIISPDNFVVESYDANGKPVYKLINTRGGYGRVYPFDTHVIKEWQRSIERAGNGGVTYFDGGPTATNRVISTLDYHPGDAENVLDNLVNLMFPYGVAGLTTARRNYFLCHMIGFPEYFNKETETIGNTEGFTTAIASFYVDGWLKYYGYYYFYNKIGSESAKYMEYHQAHDLPANWGTMTQSEKETYALEFHTDRASKGEADGFSSKIEDAIIILGQSAEYKYK